MLTCSANNNTAVQPWHKLSSSLDLPRVPCGTFKLLQKLGGGSILGPLMIGGEKPFQIVQMGSSVSDIVNSASFAAYNSLYSN